MRGVMLVVLVAACGGDDRRLEVSDQRRPIAEAMTMPFSWSTTGGSRAITSPNTTQFPQVLTIRLRVYEPCGHDDGDECESPIASGSVAPITGAPCAVTIPTSCADGLCYTELEMTALGDCVLKISAETTDGFDASTCWYRAVYEATNPLDPKVADMYDAQVDVDLSRCASML